METLSSIHGEESCRLLSMGFFRQEYWSGLPFPSPGDLPNAGIEPTSLMSPALADGNFATWEALLACACMPVQALSRIQI